jgi:ribosomal protein S18 acetylase RimI-like enzyme
MTNFFAPRQQVEKWAARGILSWAKTEDCVLIFRRSGDFHHMYHAAASTVALAHTFSSGVAPRGTLVSDLVGREDQIAPMVRAYEMAGFRVHTTLVRMVRVIHDSCGDDSRCCEGVAFAAVSDVPAVRTFLVQLLDRFADQIPEEDELQIAAASGNILMVRRQDSLGGLLIFDRTGLTATLRYWYVSPECRGQGIGAQLMRTFFRLSRACRRIILWVAADNKGSIAKYSHYGFQVEQLTDRIMTRKNTIEDVLRALRPEFDFRTSDDFIGDGMLDSHDVVTLVADLDRIYGISIKGVDILPENFQSIAAIERLLRGYSVEP